MTWDAESWKGSRGAEKAILTAMVAVILITVVGAVWSGNPTTYIGFGTLVCVSLLSTLAQLHSARRAETDAVDASRRMEDLRGVADTTHALVNSGYLAQLLVNRDLAEWKAIQLEARGDVPEARAAREEAGRAEAKYRDHLARQRRVDRESEATE